MYASQAMLDQSTSPFPQQILALETETWDALKQENGGIALLPYLADDCIMIFPATTILSSASTPKLIDILTRSDLKPWTAYELHNINVLPIGAQGASISYRVVAARGKLKYEMLVTSVWRDLGQGWKMILHQQTPLSGPA